jgi:hypothetical protein
MNYNNYHAFGIEGVLHKSIHTLCQTGIPDCTLYHQNYPQPGYLLLTGTHHNCLIDIIQLPSGEEQIITCGTKDQAKTSIEALQDLFFSISHQPTPHLLKNIRNKLITTTYQPTAHPQLN